MDRERFDLLTRGLAAEGTRRRVLRALATLVVGGVALPALAESAVAGKCPRRRRCGAGKREKCCKQGERCQRGTCGPACPTALCSGRCCPHGTTCEQASCQTVCIVCGPECPGEPADNPTKTVTFTALSDPNFCGVNVNLTGFAGCTSYPAEYWVRSGKLGDVTLGPTNLFGASTNVLGSYAQGGEVDIRINGVATGFVTVAC